MVETSRSIQRGAPALETVRPDLPDHIRQTVASALLVNPQRRPSAERLARELRDLPKRRRKPKGSKPSNPPLSRRAFATERLIPGALAGVASGWIAPRLAFSPAGWPLGLAAAGAGLGFAAPRAGLIFALAVAFFPLANISTGLAIVYAVLAGGWVALNWRDARAGLPLRLRPGPPPPPPPRPVPLPV